MSEATKEIIITLIQVVVPLLIGYIAKGCKQIFKKFVNNDTKRKIAENVVMFVEQTCKDLHGKEKFDEAKKAFIKLLNEKKIPFTEAELDILIESAVGEFNDAFFTEEVKKISE